MTSVVTSYSELWDLQPIWLVKTRSRFLETKIVYNQLYKHVSSFLYILTTKNWQMTTRRSTRWNQAFFFLHTSERNFNT